MPDETNSSIGNIPQSSEDFGNLPHASEPFRTIPNDSAAFGNSRRKTERNENHTLTVREAARLFEAAGVARTERSIINWCQPNPQGLARIDAYFDMNERRWFVTPESVERAISEEKAKATKNNDPLPKGSERPSEAEKTSGQIERPDTASEAPDPERTNHLEQEVLDLKILNGGKDFLIDQLRKERDGFIAQLVDGSRRIGQLESELRQLSAPKDDSNPLSPDS